MCVPWQTSVALNSSQHDWTSLQGNVSWDLMFASKKNPKQVSSIVSAHVQPRNVSSQNRCWKEPGSDCGTGRVQHQLLMTGNFPAARCPPLRLHPNPHPGHRRPSALQGSRGILPGPNTLLQHTTRNPIPAHRQNARCIYRMLLAALPGTREARQPLTGSLGNFFFCSIYLGWGHISY